MKRHSLLEYLESYRNFKKITLKFGVHLINIDLDCKGSYAIIKAFYDYKFEFVSFDSDHKYLVLEY